MKHNVVSIKKVLLTIVLSMFIASPATAQFASQKDASYMIITKVIADHKINDEGYGNDVEKLRDNERFNRKLAKMVEKLDNSRNSNSKNKQVLKILEKAGKDIDRVLGVN